MLWKPLGPDEDGGWGMKNSISTLFGPVQLAVSSSWEGAELDAIGIAIQQWSGDERFDGLRETQLRDWLSKTPPGFRRSRKLSAKDAPPRWRTWAIVEVADLIHTHGDQMASMLRLGEEPEFVLTGAERIAMLEKRNVQLEQQLAAAGKATKCAQDGQRQAAKRLKVDRAKQRAADRQKLDERLAEAKEKLAAKAAEEVRVASEAAVQQADADSQERVQQLTTQVSTARKQARAVEGDAANAVRNLARAQEAEHELAAANTQVDEVMQHFKAAAAAKQKGLAIQKQVNAMPTWRPVVGKGSGRGGQKLEWGTRVIIYSMLAMMVPSAAVGAVIVAIVKRTAPWLNPVAPTAATVREMRFELRLVEEALAGLRRVAAAYRVRQLGFDETTKFQDPSMVTSVLVEPTPGAKPQVVIMRAAYATGGGTSQHLVDATEEKCFARARGFLEGWEAECKRMYPNHMWTGPDPARCGLQRLGGGGAIQSDTCTPARCTKRLLAAEIAKQVKEKHLDWAQLSEEAQEAAIRVHTHDCWQHIRNIFLKAMSTAQSAHVRDSLKEELEAFSSWERMETDFDNLLRACYKVPAYSACGELCSNCLARSVR